LGCIEEDLIEGERIIAIMHPHPIIYLREIIDCIIFSVILYFLWPRLVVVVIIVLIYALWRSSTYEYGITNLRIVKKYGILNRRLSIINLEQLESLSINHGGIIGGLLGSEWGHLTAKGMGETIVFEFILNPHAVRKQILELKA
jgi:hypothetical protein